MIPTAVRAARSLAYAFTAAAPTGLSGGGTMYSPTVSRLDPSVAAVACDMGSLFLTTDAGTSWQMLDQRSMRMPGSPPSGDWHRWSPCPVAFAQDSADLLVAAGPGRPLAGFRRSTATWDSLPITPALGQRELVTALLVRALPSGQPDGPDARNIYVGTTDGAYLRGPGGTRQQLVYTPDGNPTNIAGPIPGPVIAIVWSFNQNFDAPVIVVATPTAVYRSVFDNIFQPAGSGLPPLDVAGLQLVDLAACSTANDLRLYATVAHQDLGAVAAAGAGVYVTASTDANNWTIANGGLPSPEAAAGGPAVARCEQLAVGNGNALEVFVAVRFIDTTGRYHRVYRSLDAGTNWHHCLNVSADPARNPGQGSLNLQDQGGWVDIPPFNPDFGGAMVGLGAAGSPARVLATNQAALFVSQDGGNSWLERYTSPSGTSAALMCNGLVVTSAWQYLVHPAPPAGQQLHFIAYTDVVLARSTDGGASWQSQRLRAGSGQHYNTVYELAAAEDATCAGMMWAAVAQQHDLPYQPVTSPGGDVLASGDYGASWNPISSGLPAGNPIVSVVLDPVPGPGADPKQARRLWCAAYGDGVYKSEDSGNTWVRCPGQPPVTTPRNTAAVYRLRLRSGTLFCSVAGADGNDGALARSVDGGNTWVTETLSLTHPSGDPASLRVTDYGVHPSVPSTQFVCTAGYWDSSSRHPGGIWKTVDAGASWSNVTALNNVNDGGTLPDWDPDYVSGFSVEFDPTQASQVIATTIAHGAWFSPTAGSDSSAQTTADWQSLPMPFLNGTRATFSNGKAYVATFGGGTWTMPAPASLAIPGWLKTFVRYLRRVPLPRPPIPFAPRAGRGRHGAELWRQRPDG